MSQSLSPPSAVPLPSGLQPSDPIPFHMLGEYVFQGLCRDLFFAEPDIASCDVYGVRGEAQHGIDVRAYRHDGTQEVGQCKCYKSVQPKLIKDASDDFFRHWDTHWKHKQLKRFILFLASDAETRACQRAIDEQHQRFAAVAIRYEVWTAATLRNKLRPHPEIVRTYIANADQWLPLICGEAVPTGGIPTADSPTSVLVDTVLVDRIASLTRALSGSTVQELTRMQTMWEQGHQQEVIDWLEVIHQDDVHWSSLPAALQADVLRFLAQVRLQETNDITAARELFNQAAACHPTDDDERLHAYLSYRAGAVSAACTILEGRTDAASQHLYAALLLETGQFEQSSIILAAITNPTHETWRVQALWYLSQHQVGEARLAIAKALEARPSSLNIRLWSARIDYWSVLVPAAYPDMLQEAWPYPVEWALLRRDDRSLSYLRRAAAMFRAIADDVGVGRAERQLAAVWHLACLSNDPDRQAAAEATCQRLLDADLTDYQVIVWASARRFVWDYQESTRALNRLVSQERVTIPVLLALVLCYLMTQHSKKAWQVLEQQRAFFVAQEAEEVWYTWAIEVRLRNGHTQRAAALLRDAEQRFDCRHERSAVARANARHPTAWEAAAAQLLADYTTTHDPRLLFDYGDIMLRHQQGHRVADYASTLVREIATDAAVRMGAYALYHAGRFVECYTLIDGHRSLFAQQKLPRDLWRLCVVSLHASGRWSIAVQTAEALVQDDPSPEHLLHLMRLYSDKGDLIGLRQVARRLHQEAALSGEQALWVARYLQWDDRTLAQAVWRTAIDGDLPDAAVGHAVQLGYQLGMDAAMGALLQRMVALADDEDAPVQRYAVTEIPDVIHLWQAHTAQQAVDYLHGRLPVHILGDQVPQSLARWYHQQRTAPVTRAYAPLCVRYGGQALPADFMERYPKMRLHLDVTAFLLSAHLDLLDQVEQTFHPLYVPADLVEALHSLREQNTPQQPERITRYYRPLLQLLDTQQLQVLDSSVPSTWASVAAQVPHGVLVGFSPDAGPVEDMPLATTTIATMLHVLHQHGVVTTEVVQEVCASVESHEQQVAPADQLPSPGTPLIWWGSIPDCVVTTGVLAHLCAWFSLYLFPARAQEIHDALRAYQDQQATVAWFGTLIERLGRGFDAGTYQALPMVELPLAHGDESPLPPVLRCVLTLLGAPRQSQDVLWIDDRYIARSGHAAGAPIVSVYDILRWLCHAEIMPRPIYYQRLSTLRAAPVWYLPLDADEILYYLRQAPVDAQGVRETPSLRMIRQYGARCLRHGAYLHHPGRDASAPASQGELDFIISFVHTFQMAYRMIWHTETERTHGEAWSTWLLDHYAIDYVGVQLLWGRSEHLQDIPYMTAGMFATMIAHVWTNTHDRDGSTPTAALDWYYRHVMRPCFEHDSMVLAATADVLKRGLFEALDPVALQDYPAELVLQERQLLYARLPVQIQQALQRDQGLMARLGYQPMITVGDRWQFPSAAFWNAVHAAINGAEANLIPRGQEESVSFQGRVDENGEERVRLHDPTTAVAHDVDLIGLGVLHESSVRREQCLERYRMWLDCTQADYRQLVTTLVAHPDPQQRIDLLLQRWEESAVVYYAGLPDFLSRQTRVQEADFLPPHAEGLLRHARLSADVGSGAAFQDGLVVAAQELLQEGGLRMAIEHLSGFPCPLPAPIHQAFLAASATERRALIHTLLRQAHSPLSLLHLIRILVWCGPEVTVYQRLARRLIQSVLDASMVPHIDTFCTMLRWCVRAFGQWHATWHWSPQVRLGMAWMHTHRLFTIMVEPMAPTDWLQSLFGAMHHQLVVRLETFSQREDAIIDGAHPTRISRESFLVDGLCASWGDAYAAYRTEYVDQAFRNLLFESHENSGIPSLFLLRDATRDTNLLQSFCGGDREQRLLPVLGADGVRSFLPAARQSLITQIFQEVHEDPTMVAAWLIIDLLYGTSVSPEIEESLQTLLAQVDMVAMYTTSPEVVKHLFPIVLRLVPDQLDEPGWCHWRDQAVTVASLLATRYGDHPQVPPHAPNHADQTLLAESAFLLDVALELARMAPDAPDVVCTFRDVVIDMVMAWRELGNLWQPGIWRLYRTLPVERAAQLWPLIVYLRS